MLARPRRRAPRRTRAARSRRSGCSGSRPRRAPARPTRRTRRGRAASPSPRAAAPSDLRRRRTGLRARRRDTRAGDRDEPLLAERDLREREDRLLRAERRHDLASGSTWTPKRRPIQPRDRLAQLRQPGARGYDDTSSTAATSASRMNAGVGSRGSPTPKSITSMPRRRASARQSSSRANGYCARPARMGESCTVNATARNRWSAAKVRSSSAISTRSSTRVRVPGRAGAEVHRVEAAGGEIGDVRPRLLRLHLESAGRAQALDERRARARHARAASSRGSRPRGRRARGRAPRPVRRAVGRVAEVERRLDACRESRSSRSRRAICVTRSTSRKTRPSISTSTGSARGPREPFERELDRVDAEPRPGRVRRAAFEDDPRVRGCRGSRAAACCRSARGRSRARPRRRPASPRTARQRVLGRARPPRGEEEQPEVVGELGRRRPSARARSSPPGRPSCRSRRARRTAPSSIRPGRLPWAGTVSVWPASSTSGLPARFA